FLFSGRAGVQAQLQAMARATSRSPEPALTVTAEWATTSAAASSRSDSVPAVRSRGTMSVAIACNLSDGVVLAVDSAVTVPDPAGGGVAKVYENAQKLF